MTHETQDTRELERAPSGVHKGRREVSKFFFLGVLGFMVLLLGCWFVGGRVSGQCEGRGSGKRREEWDSG